MIPQLKHLAAIDSKTGLANAGHFKVLSNAELERARRFDRPLAVIMADLDLLRDVNNQYGHLAGDVVLTGKSARLSVTRCANTILAGALARGVCAGPPQRPMRKPPRRRPSASNT